MKTKKLTKKYEELWIKIRDLIRSVTKNLDDYGEKYVKIKFNLDNEIPLNKMIEIPSMITVLRDVLMKITNVIHKCFSQMSILIINDIKILYYDRIDISEGADVNKTGASK